MRRGNFVCGYNILTEGVFVTRLSTNARISISRIMCFRTNCYSMRYILNYKSYSKTYGITNLPESQHIVRGKCAAVRKILSNTPTIRNIPTLMCEGWEREWQIMDAYAGLCAFYSYRKIFPFVYRFVCVILDNDQRDTYLLCFTIRLLYSSTCFEHYMLIIRRLNCIDAASGIVTLKTSGLRLLEYNLLHCL